MSSSIFTFYKIVSIDENIKDIYVGKTTNFKMRFQRHKSDCYNINCKAYNFKLYKYIRENSGWDNFDMIEIETNEYDKKDSAIRERYWIEELNATLNNDIPSRTPYEYKKEWRENNKEKVKQKDREYRKNHKEIIKEKAKEYREINKEIISEKQKEYNKINAEKKKQNDKNYYEKNKEIITEYSKRYRKENKDKINEKQREKIICKCGCKILKIYLSIHLKTKKHINYQNLYMSSN